MTEAPPMIDVDADGFDKDGFDYVYDAAPEAIEAGLVVSRPVRLRYPNGEVILATEVLITKKGFARLASQGPAA